MPAVIEEGEPGSYTLNTHFKRGALIVPLKKYTEELAKTSASSYTWQP
jgi:hypothetical protein